MNIFHLSSPPSPSRPSDQLIRHFRQISLPTPDSDSGCLTVGRRAQFIDVFLHNTTCQRALLAILPLESLAALRLVCREFVDCISPKLFERLHVNFTATKFSRPARRSALARIGKYVRELTFHMAYSDETNLSSLVDPITGGEVNFVYEPRLNPSLGARYESMAVHCLLVKQYPPLFHAATNVPAFLSVISSLPRLNHLRIDCPGVPSSHDNESAVNYALTSLRLAMENSSLSGIEKLTYLNIHPTGLIVMHPTFGPQAIDAPYPSDDSTIFWQRIRELDIRMQYDDSWPSWCCDAVHAYISAFSTSLEQLSFQWLKMPGVCPLMLHTVTHQAESIPWKYRNILTEYRATNLRFKDAALSSPVSQFSCSGYSSPRYGRMTHSFSSSGPSEYTFASDEGKGSRGPKVVRSSATNGSPQSWQTQMWATSRPTTASGWTCTTGGGAKRGSASVSHTAMSSQSGISSMVMMGCSCANSCKLSKGCNAVDQIPLHAHRMQTIGHEGTTGGDYYNTARTAPQVVAVEHGYFSRPVGGLGRYCSSEAAAAETNSLVVLPRLRHLRLACLRASALHLWHILWRHVNVLCEIEFEDFSLTHGSWFQALEPLSELCGDRHWQEQFQSSIFKSESQFPSAQIWSVPVNVNELQQTKVLDSIKWFKATIRHHYIGSGNESRMGEYTSVGMSMGSGIRTTTRAAVSRKSSVKLEVIPARLKLERSSAGGKARMHPAYRHTVSEQRRCFGSLEDGKADDTISDRQSSPGVVNKMKLPGLRRCLTSSGERDSVRSLGVVKDEGCLGSFEPVNSMSNITRFDESYDGEDNFGLRRGRDKMVNVATKSNGPFSPGIITDKVNNTTVCHSLMLKSRKLVKPSRQSGKNGYTSSCAMGSETMSRRFGSVNARCWKKLHTSTDAFRSGDKRGHRSSSVVREMDVDGMRMGGGENNGCRLKEEMRTFETTKRAKRRRWGESSREADTATMGISFSAFRSLSGDGAVRHAKKLWERTFLPWW